MGRWTWLTRHVPTRETIHRSRVLKPFAPALSQPALWRMTYRSVPRGVALGLFVGVIIPIMHTAIAALLAIPLRANVAVAAAFTLLINPLTIPPLYYAAYRIGSWELHHDFDLGQPSRRGALLKRAQPLPVLDPSCFRLHRAGRSNYRRGCSVDRLYCLFPGLEVLARQQMAPTSPQADRGLRLRRALQIAEHDV